MLINGVILHLSIYFIFLLDKIYCFNYGVDNIHRDLVTNLTKDDISEISYIHI